MPFTTHPWVLDYRSIKTSVEVLDAGARFLAATWAALGPVAGVGFGFWLARRAVREDERRKWGFDLRRMLSAMTLVTLRSTNMLEDGPANMALRGVPVTERDLCTASLELWNRTAGPLENDFYLYIELLDLDDAIRARAINGWLTTGANPMPGQLTYAVLIPRFQDFQSVLSDLILALDRKMGLNTKRVQMRNTRPYGPYTRPWARLWRWITRHDARTTRM